MVIKNFDRVHHFKKCLWNATNISNFVKIKLYLICVPATLIYELHVVALRKKDISRLQARDISFISQNFKDSMARYDIKRMDILSLCHYNVSRILTRYRLAWFDHLVRMGEYR